MRKSLGLSQDVAIEMYWVIIQNLSTFLAWLVFWIAHLVMALAAAGLLWWFQISPTDVVKAVLGATQYYCIIHPSQQQPRNDQRGSDPAPEPTRCKRKV